MACMGMVLGLLVVVVIEPEVMYAVKYQAAVAPKTIHSNIYFPGAGVPVTS